MNDDPKPLRKRTPATEAAYETRVRQLYAAAEEQRTIDRQDPAVVGPTYDQGREMARHQTLMTWRTGSKVYFCDPHSPWQQGACEARIPMCLSASTCPEKNY